VTIFPTIIEPTLAFIPDIDFEPKIPMKNVTHNYHDLKEELDLFMESEDANYERFSDCLAARRRKAAEQAAPPPGKSIGKIFQCGRAGVATFFFELL
jgi:hypothetical protein